MSKIIVESQGNIAVLTLNNGIINAIDPDVVNSLHQKFNKIKNEAEGLILCGGEKFFSIGLDIPLLIKFNRSEMSDFWYDFNDLVFDLYTVQIPTICAISGHAVAGGSILSLSCDYRFATTEPKKIGLNEIKLGVPVPYIADLLLKQAIGERIAVEMIYSGELIQISDAKKIGLINKTYPIEILKQCAIDKVAELAAFNSHAFSAIKFNRIEEVMYKYKKKSKPKNERFLNIWFTESVRVALRNSAKLFEPRDNSP